MFVELVELLRCPAGHEPSQLIASATKTENRHIVEGLLGCPVCKAEYPIRAGVVMLGDATPSAPVEGSTQEAMRIAAFLELTDARGFALLCGSWAVHARHLRELSDTPLVLVNPPVGADDAAAVIRTTTNIPFATGGAQAAALDAGQPEPLTRSVIETVRSGGRVLGPAAMPVPPGVSEIARDDRTWVGEKIAAPEPAPRLVTLKRAGG